MSVRRSASTVKPCAKSSASLGFSERGIEGAVALRMSRDAVDALIDGKGVGLMVDLKPGLTEEMLRERIAREMAEMGPEGVLLELLRKARSGAGHSSF